MKPAELVSNMKALMKWTSKPALRKLGQSGAIRFLPNRRSCSPFLAPGWPALPLGACTWVLQCAGCFHETPVGRVPGFPASACAAGERVLHQLRLVAAAAACHGKKRLDTLLCSSHCRSQVSLAWMSCVLPELTTQEGFPLLPQLKPPRDAPHHSSCEEAVFFEDLITMFQPCGTPPTE